MIQIITEGNQKQLLFLLVCDYDLHMINCVYFAQVSKSSLKYVTIEYAGMGPGREAVSAVMSRSVPPRLTHVDVLHSAHSGINATLPGTFLHLRGGIIKDNAGEGRVHYGTVVQYLKGLLQYGI